MGWGVKTQPASLPSMSENKIENKVGDAAAKPSIKSKSLDNASKICANNIVTTEGRPRRRAAAEGKTIVF